MRLLYLSTGETDPHLCRALRELGHTVEALPAEEAAHADDDPDSVVIGLPAPSPEWASRLAERWPAAFHIQAVDDDNRSLAAATLRAGADACFAKPIEVREIAVRLEAAARRSPPGATGVPFTLVNRRLVVDGETIPLTPTEYVIVQLLARRPGQVFTAEEIGERLWTPDAHGNPASVRAAISRLGSRARRAHGWSLIMGGRGLGYRFALRRGD